MGQWPVYVGFTMCEQAFKREVKKMRIPTEVHFLGKSELKANACVHSFETDRGETCFLITLQPSPKASKEQVAAMVAHEAVHVAQGIWSSIGERYPGKEAEAYLVQYITQSCLEIAFKSNKTRKTVP